MEMPTEDELREMAKARVSVKRHAAIYVIVNIALAVFWFVTSNGEFGSYWPLWTHIGWGFGLAMHAFGVYGPGRDSEKREMDRLRTKYGGTR